VAAYLELRDVSPEARDGVAAFVLLEAQLGRLDVAEQQVLEVGSVAWAAFAVASVTAGGHTAPEVVEAVCERLTRQGQFLEDRGLVEWPDGKV
jgi:hypothetical protein